jgi:hypothetical protein
VAALALIVCDHVWLIVCDHVWLIVCDHVWLIVHACPLP